MVVLSLVKASWGFWGTYIGFNLDLEMSGLWKGISSYQSNLPLKLALPIVLEFSHQPEEEVKLSINTSDSNSNYKGESAN